MQPQTWRNPPNRFEGHEVGPLASRVPPVRPYSGHHNHLRYPSGPSSRQLDPLQHTALRLVTGPSYLRLVCIVMSNLLIELELYKGLLLAHLQVAKTTAIRIQTTEVHRDRRRILFLKILRRDHLIKVHKSLGCLNFIKILYLRFSNNVRLHLRLRND